MGQWNAAVKLPEDRVPRFYPQSSTRQNQEYMLLLGLQPAIDSTRDRRALFDARLGNNGA
jgi:hypothetical protein